MGMVVACTEWLPRDPEGKNAAIFREHGLELGFTLCGMFADHLLPSRRTPPELEYRRVVSLETRSAFADLNAIGYNSPLEFGREVSDLDGFWDEAFAYVGYKNGRAVTTAATYLEDIRLYVGWVATLPEARRNGYAEAVMRHSLEEAAWSSDLSRTVLHATELGYPIYRAMGYRQVAFFRVYFPQSIVNGMSNPGWQQHDVREYEWRIDLMHRIGILSFSSPGHFYPLTALWRRLQLRTHEVVYFQVADLERPIREAGGTVADHLRLRDLLDLGPDHLAANFDRTRSWPRAVAVQFLQVAGPHVSGVEQLALRILRDDRDPSKCVDEVWRGVASDPRIPKKSCGGSVGFRRVGGSHLVRGGSLGTSADPWNELVRAAGRLLMAAADPYSSERILSWAAWATSVRPSNLVARSADERRRPHRPRPGPDGPSERVLPARSLHTMMCSLFQ
jgi:ribosomal protein S18 acetylase RimI-like enzyme